MIWNVIDKRTRPYRWAKINAIIEATWHDNTVADTDIAPGLRPQEEEVTYDQREGVSLQDAISWANDQTVSSPSTCMMRARAQPPGPD